MKDSGVEWIGEIPEQWQVCAVKNLCSMEAGKSLSADSIREEGLFPVYGGNGVRGFYSDNNCDGAVILIGRQGALCGNVHIADGRIWATEHAVITRNYSITDLKYLYYLLTAMELNQYVTTVAAQPGLAVGTIKNIKTLLPPFIEQKKIGKYLNGVCVKIDSIIMKQQTIIEKLKEYKISLVTEAVTKGLNKNVPLIDSGTAWMGNVPVGWKKYRIANLYDQTSISGREDLPILTVSINSGISDSELDEAEQERHFVRSEDRTKYKRVRPGDLVYNMMRAWQGAFGAARVDGMVSPAYVTCRPKNNVQIDSRFIEYLFRTPIAIEEMHRYSHGVADFRLRLYWNEFRNIQVCLPDINEQRIIADYIDVMMKKIECHIRERESIIAKLKLYRSSLIYEIVTGKKAVD